jgi:lysophospholipase L1-like esterase
MTKKARLKRLLRDSVIVSLITMVLLAIIEGGLRLAYFVRNSAVDVVLLPYTAAQDWGVVPPWMDGLRILERDPVLLWKNRPGVKRSYLDVYRPAHVEADRIALIQQFFPAVPSSLRNNPVWSVTINSQGFRDREFTREKRRSSFRIVCVGDSWSFGANVVQDRAFPQRVAALLEHEHPGADFEVLNLGVMGYTSRQGLELMKRYVLALQPDLVLIGFAMNDAIVQGWRDKDVVGRPETSRQLNRLLDHAELYKLARYWRSRFRHQPWTIGDYLKKVGRSDGTPDAIWTGREASESADYDQLEAITRVSPRDYEQNLNEMIDLAEGRGAGVVLLFNELWSTPYRKIVGKVAGGRQVPWVDSEGIVDQARQGAERSLGERLGLRVLDPPANGSKETVEVVFRVYADQWPVSKALYIAGNHPNLGDSVPNSVALHDDGTNGDQRAGDGVWSYKTSFAPGTRFFYVYTNSGRKGQWEGVDVPELRHFVVPSTPGATLYRPIETFGAFPFQADGWHTNAAGYELIAKAIVEVLDKDEKVREHLRRRSVAVGERISREGLSVN